MDNIWPAAIALGAALLLGSCGELTGGSTRMSRYEWLPTDSAPKAYPMWIVDGQLSIADGNLESVPARQILNNGWGERGALRIEGEPLKGIPLKLRISFYSFVEDQFFAGEFALDHVRIRSLFDQGAPLPDGRRSPYNRLIVGVAPGGRVSAWLSADQVVTKVAGSVVAPADLLWSEIGKNPDISREEFRGRVLDYALTREARQRVLSTAHLPGFWGEQTAVPYTLSLTGASTDVLLWIRGLDGTRDWIDLSDPARRGVGFKDALPLPASLSLTWLANTGARRAEIELDREEVLAAFSRLGPRDTAIPTLVIEIGDVAPMVHLLLRRDDEMYRFERVQVRVFGG